MKKLILVVGLYFLVKAGIDVYRVIDHFSSCTFNTAYGAGFATGQIVAPLLFLVVGILLVRHCWPARSPASRQVPSV
jgi:hypothetical protein